MKGRIEGLDVLRGIAVGLVLLRHGWPEVFGGAGIVGVVIFFALSGYLITGVLVRDIDTVGHIRYGRFYRNRALRLIPALIAVTSVITLVAAIWNLLGDRGHILRTTLVALTYTADLPFEHGSPAIGHLWTLAVEEQFYLFWPLVLVLGFKLRRLFGTIVIVSILVELTAISMLIYVAPSWAKLYALPFPWIIAMIIGAGLQLALHRYGIRWPTGLTRVTLIVGATLMLVVTSLLPDLKETLWVYAVGTPLVALSASVLIVELKAWVVIPAIALRPLLALGTISYAAYLWNYPVVLWLDATLGKPFSGPLSIVITIIAATASWFLVEQPALRWKESLDHRANHRRRSDSQMTI